MQCEPQLVGHANKVGPPLELIVRILQGCDLWLLRMALGISCADQFDLRFCVMCFRKITV